MKIVQIKKDFMTIMKMLEKGKDVYCLKILKGLDANNMDVISVDNSHSYSCMIADVKRVLDSVNDESREFIYIEEEDNNEEK